MGEEEESSQSNDDKAQDYTQRSEHNKRSRAPILVQKMLAADTILYLFDCSPPELRSLGFTPHPYQQYLRLAPKLDTEQECIRAFKMRDGKPAAFGSSAAGGW